MPQALLQKAVEAYKAGRRGEARALLLKYVEEDQSNELAWLLLSNLVPELEDRIIALENALTLNPDNTRAAAQLWKLKQKRYADPKQLADQYQQRLQAAIEARDNGQGMVAFNLLRQLLREDDRNEQAWLLLSELSPDTDGEITALENLLLLNPNHVLAKARLEQLQRFRNDPLGLAQLYEEWGEAEKARDLYIRVAFESASPIERREAERRIQDTEIRQQVPDMRVVKPELTLVRLMTGALIFYAALIFVHGGLHPLKISPAFWLGGFSVLVGSFLLVVSSVPETRILWQRIWRKLGREKAPSQKRLKPLGVLLWALPNIWIIVDGVLRFFDTLPEITL
jgi:hypothetical protein